MRDSISSCCGSVTDKSQEEEQGSGYEHAHNQADDNRAISCCAAGPAMASALSGSQKVANGLRTPIRIMQMDCPTEEALIRKKLGTMSDVISLEFNLMQRVLMVEHTVDALEAILEGIRSLGFEPEVFNAQGELPAKTEPKKLWWPLVIAAVAALMAEAVGWFGLADGFSIGFINNGLAAALALIAVGLSGLSTYKKGWVAIRHGDLNINALMSIAVTGALILGQWPEAAMVMVLFTIAELIEAKSLDRARQAIAGLLKLAPDKATVQQPDGRWLEVAAVSVAVGSLVRVKPGERIALDGMIVRGRSTINQAPITGESLPVDKEKGDQVYAGTINESGSFEYKVTAAADDSALARIIHAVEEAQGSKAPTQRFVDQFARLYTPIVFCIALAVAVVPPLLMGGIWFDWVYKALVLLVIACPCALVISTPVTIVSGLAAAARHGILIKGGVYLEEGRKLSWLALDKTGTLTYGKPVLTESEIVIGQAATQTTGYTIDQCNQLAASLAARSDHPVSQAIVKALSNAEPAAIRGADSTSISLTHMDVERFTAIAGRGVQGDINGKTYALGNHRLVEELGLCSGELEARVDSLERQGKSVVLLMGDQQVLALFAVADTVKETSRAAIAELHQLGIKTIMLTGDNQHTATTIAQQVGIDEARGNLLPEGKLAAITVLEEEGVVGMVGDGINDAPALAQAKIGFAMGAMGSDTAIETADVALMDDDLRKVPAFVRLSRQTHTILVQNITLALGIKTVFLVLALMGIGTMWMAVFADMGASLLVVGNGLRLLRK